MMETLAMENHRLRLVLRTIAASARGTEDLADELAERARQALDEEEIS